MDGVRRPSRCALVVVIAALLGGGPIAAQQELFEQGNLRYQEGDWSGAIEAYEAVISAGFDSADLRYNLGNAYFKNGELGLAILEWERARVRAPADQDIAANLELARSLTTDVVEPLPTFWLVSAWRWWVDWLPGGLLVGMSALGWLSLWGGVIAAVLSRGPRRLWSRRIAVGGAVVLLLFGANLAARELGLARAERGVVLANAVPVRSAPAADDNLTLFEVHEGTGVRIDQRAGDWAEIVLDDGKVGWIRLDVLGIV